MKKNLIAVSLFLLSINTHACTFSWAHYGSDSIRDIIKTSIASNISNKYCQKYNNANEIVIQYEGYVLKGLCVGYAAASIRKRGTKTLQVYNFNGVKTDTNCSTIGEADRLTAEAALDAIDNLMSAVNNETYKITP